MPSIDVSEGSPPGRRIARTLGPLAEPPALDAEAPVAIDPVRLLGEPRGLGQVAEVQKAHSIA